MAITFEKIGLTKKHSWSEINWSYKREQKIAPINWLKQALYAY